MLVIDCFAYAARLGASARRAARHVSRHRLLHLAQARRRLLPLCRASGCFGTSRGLSRDSSSTTSPRTGSSSTTLPTSRVRVPRHAVRLVVDYFTSRRLVVDYFTYAARPVSSARRAACRVTHRQLLRLAQARRRLLLLCRASGCLGTSRGSLSTTSTMPRVRLLRHVARHVARLVTRLVVDYFASCRLVVDYFTYVARLVALARRAACRVTHRRLLCLA
jgi:hypothetical protein